MAGADDVPFEENRKKMVLFTSDETGEKLGSALGVLGYDIQSRSFLQAILSNNVFMQAILSNNAILQENRKMVLFTSDETGEKLMLSNNA